MIAGNQSLFGGGDSIMSLYNNIPFDKEGGKHFLSDISQELKGTESVTKGHKIKNISDGNVEIDKNLSIGKSNIG